MAWVDLADLCDAIATTLDEIDELKRVESYNELKEDFRDTPMAQVYPESGETDVTSGTDRSGYRGGKRSVDTLFYVDIPCNQRSHLAEDMQATMEIIDLVEAKLTEQNTKPYFGHPDIMSFRWRWERITFERSGGLYVGVRFQLWVRTF